jgi:protein-tyrosine phosphatase
MPRVLFVCLGNICRSPLAEGIARHHASLAWDADQWVFDSAGTADYHSGEPPNPSSVRIARQRGIDISGQRARQVVAADLRRFDVLVAMDRSNLSGLQRLDTAADGQLVLFRSFDEVAASPDVPDPWGHGMDAFAEVYDILDRTMPRLLAYARGSAAPLADGA